MSTAPKPCNFSYVEKRSILTYGTNFLYFFTSKLVTNIKFILRRLVYNMYITDEEEKLVNNLTEYELNCIVSANLNYSIKNLRTNGKGDTNDI